jgi:hypothetical protein
MSEPESFASPRFENRRTSVVGFSAKARFGAHFPNRAIIAKCRKKCGLSPLRPLQRRLTRGTSKLRSVVHPNHDFEVRHDYAVDQERFHRIAGAVHKAAAEFGDEPVDFPTHESRIARRKANEMLFDKAILGFT